MFKALTLIAAAAAIYAFQPSAAHSYDVQFQAHVKSGEPTRVRRFFDCVYHRPGGGGGAFAEHGTVTVKYVLAKHCGNAQEPTYVIWYISPPGFRGSDTVTVPVGLRTTVRVDVTVD